MLPSVVALTRAVEDLTNPSFALPPGLLDALGIEADGHLLVEGAPAREGAEILDASGKAVGVVTSGGFAPSLGKAIALGFVPPALTAIGTRLQVSVRGRAQSAEVVPTPFVPHRYHRG